MEAAQRHSGSAKVRFAALALHIFTAQLQLPLWPAIRASVPGPMTCLDQDFVSFWTVQGLFIPLFLDHVPHTSLSPSLSLQCLGHFIRALETRQTRFLSPKSGPAVRRRANLQVRFADVPASHREHAMRCGVTRYSTLAMPRSIRPNWRE